MLVLDTDHVSLLLRPESREGAALEDRLAALGGGKVATTIVTFEEQFRGWLAVIAKARRPDQLVTAYGRLQAFLGAFRQIPVLPFDADAAREFERLRRLRLRIGMMDLRIAAMALSRGATLLTRNKRDFEIIPDLQIEDWTVTP